jgi:hypothetical protein
MNNLITEITNKLDNNHYVEADDIEELISYIESEWIPVKERLPEHGQIVLVYDPTAIFETKKIRHVCYYGYAESHIPFIENYTHWKPKIEPPTL